MGDEKRNRNRGIFIKLTRKSAEKEIQRRENKLNRELSRAEKRKIMERVAKRAKVQTAVIASVASLISASASAKVDKALLVFEKLLEKPLNVFAVALAASVPWTIPCAATIL